MPISCAIEGCKADVPDELEGPRLCISHFTLQVEKDCADMRLETVRGQASPARQGDILRFIGERGAVLARVATSSPRLPDELKARILSTFLTLMNLRENVARAAARWAAASGENVPSGKV